MHSLFDVCPQVRVALQQNKPVLALESTLITHGLPFPHNLEIVKESEKIARAHGVTPATIAIIKGQIKIGLSSEELDLLIKEPHPLKASRRDIPFILSQKKTAGTTVAATLYLAHTAGIKVFATGGIGGVHRGSEGDISADLLELTRIPMVLVCAGPKAILDLPKTLEFLETFSVPVVGYQTENLPAFYSATSPYKLAHYVEQLPELVDIIKTHWQLGLPSSILVANPIPQADELPAELIEPAISQALAKAHQQYIQGKEMTPFLLAEVRNITEGRSVKANMSLIKNNVALASKLAYSLLPII